MKCENCFKESETYPLCEDCKRLEIIKGTSEFLKDREGLK